MEVIAVMNILLLEFMIYRGTDTWKPWPYRIIRYRFSHGPRVVVVCCGVIRIYSYLLTYWGWVMHIYLSIIAMIGSDNGLSPGRRQAIIWTNVGILSIGPLGTHCSEILIKIIILSFKKMHFVISSEICRALRFRYVKFASPVLW